MDVKITEGLTASWWELTATCGKLVNGVFRPKPNRYSFCPLCKRNGSPVMSDTPRYFEENFEAFEVPNCKPIKFPPEVLDRFRLPPQHPLERLIDTGNAEDFKICVPVSCPPEQQVDVRIYEQWINRLQRDCLENSKRWFPSMHSSLEREVFLCCLGMSGELGEVLDELPGSDGQIRELGDLVIYCLVLAQVLELRIDLQEPPRTEIHVPRYVLAAVETVKKVMRYSNWKERLDGQGFRSTLRYLLGAIVGGCLDNGVDLDVLETTMQLNELRYQGGNWGERP